MSYHDRSLPRLSSPSQEPPPPAEVPDSASDSSDGEPTQYRRISTRFLLENSRGKSIMETGSSSTINSNSNSIAGCSNYIPRTYSPNILPILGLEGGGTEINPGIPAMEANGQHHSSSDAQTSNLAEPQLANMEVVDETMPNPELGFSLGRPEAPVAASEAFEEDFVYAVEDANSEDEVMVVLSPGNVADRRKRDKIKSGSEGKGAMETQLVDSNDTDATSSCSICMEPWTSGGNHRISCLPCGHLFGRSCIRKWIRQSGRNIGKCPQCNKMCKLRDIRTLYVSRIAVVDGEMLQELTSLRAENEKLMLENKNLKDESHQRKKGRSHHMEIEQLKFQKEKLLREIQTLCGQKALLGATMPEQFGSRSGFRKQFVAEECREYGMQSREPYGSFNRSFTNTSNDFIHPANPGSSVSAQSPYGLNRGAECQFKIWDELPLHGAKYFDIDALSQMLLVSQKASDLCSQHFLTKISLLALSGGEHIHLPNETGAIRDIHIAPIGTKDPGRLALVASTGKKLSVVSYISNNVVLTYNLQSPAWSCAWESSDPNRVYAGLQNGMLLLFDLRKTSSPVNFINGLGPQPIHTLHSVACSRVLNNEYSGRAILSASCSGPALWHVDDQHCRPYYVPGLESQGVCISLAYCGLGDIGVASYRPQIASQVGGSTCISPSQEGLISSQSRSPEGYADSSSFSISPRKGSHYILRKSDRSSSSGDRMVHREISTADSYDSLGIDWNCNREKVMFGHVRAVGTTKSAILTVPVPGRGLDCKQTLFAYGDELSRAVTVWDTETLCVTEHLKPHENAILDVKHVQIEGKDILGCVSEKTLQIYERR